MPSSQPRSIQLDILKGTEGSASDRDDEWLSVFRHYQPRLESYFRSRLGDAADADDVVAETWSRAFLFIGSLSSAAALWSWLTTIGNNVIRDRQRRAQRRPELRESDLTNPEGTLEAFIDGWSFREFASEGPAGHARAAVLDRLSSEEREYLELLAVEGLSHHEIAQRLHLPSAAASRQRLRRIRVRLTGA
jgi:RNA polymerase sigma factor (sigma-70 family)